MKAIDIIHEIHRYGLDNSQFGLVDTRGIRDIDSWVTFYFQGWLEEGFIPLERDFLYCYTSDFGDEAVAKILDGWKDPVWLIPID